MTNMPAARGQPQENTPPASFRHRAVPLDDVAPRTARRAIASHLHPRHRRRAPTRGRPPTADPPGSRAARVPQLRRGRAPASLSAAAVDCALPPETQVSSTTSTSAPSSTSALPPARSATRTQPGFTPRACTCGAATASRTKGSSTHDRTRRTSGCAPGRPCPLGTTATAPGPLVIPAASHTDGPRSARNAASRSRSRPAAATASAARARSDLYRRRSSASDPPRTAYPVGATTSASSPPASPNASSHW